MKHFAPVAEHPSLRSIEVGVFENPVQADSGMAVLRKQAKARYVTPRPAAIRGGYY
jgi:hypothetical protein